MSKLGVCSKEIKEKKELIIKNKTRLTVTTFLLLIFAVSLLSLPTTSAWNSATTNAVNEGMKWDFPNAANYDASSSRLFIWERWADKIPTHVFVEPTPDPVGIGQSISLVMFQPQWPPAATVSNDIKWYGYTLTITKPDGSTENLGPFDSDPTGSTYTLYTPAEIGEYTVTVKFPEQFYKWYGSSAERAFYGVTFLESTYTTNFTVQAEPIQQLTWGLPLPTEYWTRPIHGMNTEWYRVSSNWLGSAKDLHNGDAWSRFQPDGVAPNSPHILWTKPIQDGGVVGGTNVAQAGNEFYTGQFYSMRMVEPIIMHGRLYYKEPFGYDGDDGDSVCVDLLTGEEIWRRDDLPALSFGYYYAYENPNQHGVVPAGTLFTNNFARAFDPISGDEMSGMENVPSRSLGAGYISETIGPSGELLRYNIDNAGTNSNPDWRLTQWNSSRYQGNVPSTAPKNVLNPDNKIDASSPDFYDWNVSASWREGMSSVTIRSVQLDDVLIGTNGTHPTRPAFDFPEELTIWAISLKPESRGHLLWMNTITVSTPENDNLCWMAAAEGVIVLVWSPTMEWVGYDMYTGQKLWQTEAQTDWNVYAYFTMPTTTRHKGGEVSIAYGKLFTTGYVGHITAYDLYNGSQLWQYAAPSNMSIWEYYTLFIGAIADGKIYTATMEHSAQTPLFKGHQVRAIDVDTGEEVWSMYGWGDAYSPAVADGVYTYLDLYWQQIVAVGKGPSETKVSIQNDVITQGSSVLIKGSIIDKAAGTKQNEQAGRFPNGVPVVSDESQGAWMEYVYMQKPRPMDATGVPVTLSVVDANGNYREIGTTTTTDGFFSFNWKPDIEGLYTVYASFAGSESYWPSSAMTSFAVDPAAAKPAPTDAPLQSMADTYLLPGIIAIIVVIAIGFAITILVLKKRP